MSIPALWHAITHHPTTALWVAAVAAPFAAAAVAASWLYPPQPERVYDHETEGL